MHPSPPSSYSSSSSSLLHLAPPPPSSSQECSPLTSSRFLVRYLRTWIGSRSRFSRASYGTMARRSLRCCRKSHSSDAQSSRSSNHQRVRRNTYREKEKEREKMIRSSMNFSLQSPDDALGAPATPATPVKGTVPLSLRSPMKTASGAAAHPGLEV